MQSQLGLAFALLRQERQCMGHVASAVCEKAKVAWGNIWRERMVEGREVFTVA